MDSYFQREVRVDKAQAFDFRLDPRKLPQDQNFVLISACWKAVFNTKYVLIKL